MRSGPPLCCEPRQHPSACRQAAAAAPAVLMRMPAPTAMPTQAAAKGGQARQRPRQEEQQRWRPLWRWCLRMAAMLAAATLEQRQQQWRRWLQPVARAAVRHPAASGGGDGATPLLASRRRASSRKARQGSSRVGRWQRHRQAALRPPLRPHSDRHLPNVTSTSVQSLTCHDLSRSLLNLHHVMKWLCAWDVHCGAPARRGPRGEREREKVRTGNRIGKNADELLQSMEWYASGGWLCLGRQPRHAVCVCMCVGWQKP